MDERGSVIAEGAFVRVLFPTNEAPRWPGLVHICYVLAVRPPLVLVAYTTTAPWPPDLALPLGVRRFSQAEAAALNQRRAFRLHLNRLARVPMTADWLPDLSAPDQGVIAMAPASLREQLYQITRELYQRHAHNITRLGV